MTIAAIVLLVLSFLDDSGFIFMITFTLALLYGASYVIGLGWHATM